LDQRGNMIKGSSGIPHEGKSNGQSELLFNILQL